MRARLGSRGARPSPRSTIRRHTLRSTWARRWSRSAGDVTRPPFLSEPAHSNVWFAAGGDRRPSSDVHGEVVYDALHYRRCRRRSRTSWTRCRRCAASASTSRSSIGWRPSGAPGDGDGAGRGGTPPDRLGRRQAPVAGAPGDGPRISIAHAIRTCPGPSSPTSAGEGAREVDIGTLQMIWCGVKTLATAKQHPAFGRAPKSEDSRDPRLYRRYALLRSGRRA